MAQGRSPARPQPTVTLPLPDAATPSLVPGFTGAVEDVYQHNLELAETNKTLMLLRKIDEIVLSAVTDQAAVMQQIAAAIAEESGFPFVALYLRDRTQNLRPQAVVTRIGDPVVQQHVQDFLSRQPISLRHPDSPVARAVRSLLIVTTGRLFEVVQPSMPIEEAEEAQERLSLTSFYICPLQVRGAVIGVMVVGSPQSPESLGFYQKSLLERLTVAVGVAIDSTLLYLQAQAAAAHLRAANRHLKELDRAKDEFISMASHQLRTPLTTIKDYLSMILEGEVGPVAPGQRRFLENAFDGSQRMVGLIADLLNVSRMSAGKFLIEKQPTDLDRMVADEVKQLQPRAAAKHLKLTYLPPAEPLPLMALDEAKTRQVVMNFIDNALYYTKAGSVAVTLVRHDDCAEFRVQDTGIGVPRSGRARLFSKFFRATNARRLRPDGTGLGLFLAKQVVAEQGGTIIFESVEGKGSVFGFALPFKPTPPPARPRRRGQPAQ